MADRAKTKCVSMRATMEELALYMEADAAICVPARSAVRFTSLSGLRVWVALWLAVEKTAPSWGSSIGTWEVYLRLVP